MGKHQKIRCGIRNRGGKSDCGAFFDPTRLLGRRPYWRSQVSEKDPAPKLERRLFSGRRHKHEIYQTPLSPLTVKGRLLDGDRVYRNM